MFEYVCVLIMEVDHVEGGGRTPGIPPVDPPLNDSALQKKLNMVDTEEAKRTN
jgi:hypothetical protein